MLCANRQMEVSQEVRMDLIRNMCSKIAPQMTNSDLTKIPWYRDDRLSMTYQGLVNGKLNAAYNV